MAKWHYGELARNEWGIDSDQSIDTCKYPENRQIAARYSSKYLQIAAKYTQNAMPETYYLCGFPSVTRYDSQH